MTIRLLFQCPLCGEYRSDPDCCGYCGCEMLEWVMSEDVDNWNGYFYRSDFIGHNSDYIQ